MAYRIGRFKAASTFIVFTFITASAVGQPATAGDYLAALTHKKSDTTARVALQERRLLPMASGRYGDFRDSVGGLASVEKEKGLKYLHQLGQPAQRYEYHSNSKFYYHLANTFARLRLYPLAMKCFLKAVKSKSARAGSLVKNDTLSGSTASVTLSFSSRDDTVVDREVQLLKVKAKVRRSKHTNFDQISNNFNDGKAAIAYAMLFHVKQPAPGKRKIFVWVNTGHTFITLIKYNADSTYSSASFGFYPEKDHLLSASPIFPGTSSTFKNDAAHQWDEVLGAFISKRKFERILQLTKDFEGLQYNLNQRNCTDFGLQAAALAGIHITDTFGRWPLGRGNNPGVTGQSILKGELHSDTSSNEEIFVDDTVLP